MRQSHAMFAVFPVLVSLACPPPGSAASPEEIATRRQEVLRNMLTEEYQPSLIAGLRWVCAMGRQPASVAGDRANGTYFTPDAGDSCVTALVRTARDNRLPELYGKLATEMGGNAAGSETLPRVIGAAVLSGDGKAPIGNGRVAVVTPALAFDAGFTVAYQEGTASKPVTVDAGKLKILAEACLGQHQDAGTCFSAGYVDGARAFKAQTASAR